MRISPLVGIGLLCSALATGALSSSHLTGTLNLGSGVGAPVSSVTCNRVFDAQVNLLPPNCVSN